MTGRDETGFPYLLQSATYGYDQNNLTLKEVHIERPHVTLWFDKDTLNLPLHYTSSRNTSASSSSLANIQHVVVTDATLTVTGENFNAAWDGLTLMATQTDEHAKYTVKLTRQLPQSTIDAYGIVNMCTKDVNVDVTARHTLGTDETAAIFTLLDVPIIHDVNGHIRGKFAFCGQSSRSGDGVAGRPCRYKKWGSQRQRRAFDQEFKNSNHFSGTKADGL